MNVQGRKLVSTGLIVTGIIFIFIGSIVLIFNSIFFNGIGKCKDEGMAVVTYVDSHIDDGTKMYKPIYMINGYEIESRISTNTKVEIGDTVEVIYNKDKGLIYTNGQKTVHTILSVVTTILFIIGFVTGGIGIIKIIAVLGVAGYMINKQNKAEQAEYENWRMQQQNMNNMQGNIQGYMQGNQNYMQNNNEVNYSNIQGINGYNQGANNNQ